MYAEFYTMNMMFEVLWIAYVLDNDVYAKFYIMHMIVWDTWIAYGLSYVLLMIAICEWWWWLNNNFDSIRCSLYDYVICDWWWAWQYEENFSRYSVLRKCSCVKLGA